MQIIQMKQLTVQVIIVFLQTEVNDDKIAARKKVKNLQQEQRKWMHAIEMNW